MEKISAIKPGDLVKVYTRIIEGTKERIASFQGIVIKIKGSDVSKTFTVRKISAGIGVERIFPFHSPLIKKIEVKKKGRVRRAKLSYLRIKRGRRIKIKEAEAERGALAAEVISEQPVAEKQPVKEAKPKEKKVETAPGAKPVEKV